MAVANPTWGAANGATSGNIAALAFPAPAGGIVAGDILIVFVVSRDNVASSIAGFTAKAEVNVGTAARVSLFWKRADGSESGTIQVTHSSGQAIRAVMGCWHGCIWNVDPFDATVTIPSTADAATPTDVAAITPATDGNYVGAVYAGWKSTTTTATAFGTLGGACTTQEVASGASGASGNRAALKIARDPTPPAGGSSTGTSNCAFTNATGTVGFHFALKPGVPVTVAAPALAGDPSINAIAVVPAGPGLELISHDSAGFSSATTQYQDLTVAAQDGDWIVVAATSADDNNPSLSKPTISTQSGSTGSWAELDSQSMQGADPAFAWTVVWRAAVTGTGNVTVRVNSGSAVSKCMSVTGYVVRPTDGTLGVGVTNTVDTGNGTGTLAVPLDGVGDGSLACGAFVGGSVNVALTTRGDNTKDGSDWEASNGNSTSDEAHLTALTTAGNVTVGFTDSGTNMYYVGTAVEITWTAAGGTPVTVAADPLVADPSISASGKGKALELAPALAASPAISASGKGRALALAGALVASPSINAAFLAPAGAPVRFWTDALSVTYHVDNTTDTFLVLGTQFSSSEAGYIRGVHFPKDSRQTAAISVSLWRVSDSAELARATYSGDSGASGWQYVAFDTPVAIAASTAYVVSVNLSFTGGTAFYYGADGGILPVSNSPLTSTSLGQYYYTGAISYPASTYTSCYFADPEYAAEAGGQPVTVAAPALTASPAISGSASGRAKVGGALAASPSIVAVAGGRAKVGGQLVAGAVVDALAKGRAKVLAAALAGAPAIDARFYQASQPVTIAAPALVASPAISGGATGRAKALGSALVSATPVISGTAKGRGLALGTALAAAPAANATAKGRAKALGTALVGAPAIDAAWKSPTGGAVFVPTGPLAASPAINALGKGRASPFLNSRGWPMDRLEADYRDLPACPGKGRAKASGAFLAAAPAIASVGVLHPCRVWAPALVAAPAIVPGLKTRAKLPGGPLGAAPALAQAPGLGKAKALGAALAASPSGPFAAVSARTGVPAPALAAAPLLVAGVKCRMKVGAPALGGSPSINARRAAAILVGAQLVAAPAISAAAKGRAKVGPRWLQVVGGARLDGVAAPGGVPLPRVRRLPPYDLVHGWQHGQARDHPRTDPLVLPDGALSAPFPFPLAE